MNLKTIVKVGGMTRLDDARLCAGFGVDLLGFALHPASEHYVPVEDAVEMMSWVQGPAFVAELSGMNVPDILSLQTEYSFAMLQVNGWATAQALMHENQKVILEWSVSCAEDIERLPEVDELAALEYLLIDSSSEAWTPAILQKIAPWAGRVAVLKTFENSMERLSEALEDFKFQGVALKNDPQLKWSAHHELLDLMEALERK